MTETHNNSTSLREACIQEAFIIVEEKGVEELSLREVARRLGVSHQAPYKHFKSRDHILAEIVSRAYTAFAKHLEQRPQTGDPQEDLRAMGTAYLEYALKHPLQYRLMFGTPLPEPEKHPDMLQNAQHAFALLQAGIEKLHCSRKGPGLHERTNFDALFIWSTLHGLSGVMKSRILPKLNLPQNTLDAIFVETFKRIGWVLQSETDEPFQSPPP